MILVCPVILFTDFHALYRLRIVPHRSDVIPTQTHQIFLYVFFFLFVSFFIVCVCFFFIYCAYGFSGRKSSVEGGCNQVTPNLEPLTNVSPLQTFIYSFLSYFSYIPF